MSSRSLRSHPLRFLLYLEWSLLGFVLVSEVLRLGFLSLPRLPLLNLLCLGIFAAMSFTLPNNKNNKTANNILYTVSEFMLIIAAIRVGFIRLFPVLFFVLAIRSCFIFARPGRLIVTGLAYLVGTALLIERFQYRSIARQLGPLASERLLFLGLMSAVFFGLVLVFCNF